MFPLTLHGSGYYQPHNGTNLLDFKVTQYFAFALSLSLSLLPFFLPATPHAIHSNGNRPISAHNILPLEVRNKMAPLSILCTKDTKIEQQTCLQLFDHLAASSAVLEAQCGKIICLDHNSKNPWTSRASGHAGWGILGVLV